jgi:WD40 repeat protein/serine/threonine protein kinase
MPSPADPFVLTNSGYSTDGEFEAIVCEISEKIDSGSTVELSEYERRHPAFAERLRRIWPTLMAMAELGHVGGAVNVHVEGESTKVGTLGDFELIREVGRGGMGVVYEATQISLGRRVALKVLPFASVMDKRALQRFKNEAMAAAALDHPNIVSVHSTGCERSVHYYAMHFVEGRTLAEVVTQLGDPEGTLNPAPAGPTMDYQPDSSQPQLSSDVISPSDETTKQLQAQLSTAGSIRERNHFRSVAEIGRQAAEALDYAHSVGVVHRDIKPSNLILDDTGKCWVTDFGLAMVESNPNLTMTGDLLGTLRYMSPEQSLAQRVVIDHRTDVYSLGITLYELLTLKPAHQGQDRQELLRRLAFEEPTAPQKLNPAIPNDLATIVSKAMAKNPSDRYATAGGFADDLNRFLIGDPIRARSPTILQHVTKWSLRHKPVVAAAAIVILLATIGLAVSNVLIAEQRNLAVEAGEREELGRAEAQRQRDEAQRERDRAKLNYYLAEMRQANFDWSYGLGSRLQNNLLQHVPSPGQIDLRGWEWYYFASLLAEPVLQRFEDIRYYPSLNWTSDSRRLVTTCGTSDITIWDPEKRQVVVTLESQVGPIRMAAFEPRTNLLAVIGAREGLEIWDLDKNEIVSSHTDEDLTFVWLGWSPDGADVAVLSQQAGVLQIWNVKLEKVLKEIKTDISGPGPAYSKHAGWSPDGGYIALAEGARVAIWEIETGRSVCNLSPNGHLGSVIWHPTSSTIATAANVTSGKPAVEVWRIPSGERQFKCTNNDVFHLDWHHGGRYLATTGGFNELTTIWDTQTGLKVRDLIGHHGVVDYVAWNTSGSRVASIGRDEVICIWDSTSGDQIQTLRGHTGLPYELVFSPDDQYVASWSWGELSLWDLQEPPWVQLNNDEGYALNYATPNKDGTNTVTVGQSDTLEVLEIWDTHTGERLRSCSREAADGTGIGFRSEKEQPVTWSPGGRKIAWVNDHQVNIWDPFGDGRITSLVLSGISNRKLRTAVWNPLGDKLAAVVGIQVFVFDVSSKKLLNAFNTHTEDIVSLAWGDNGIATGAWDGTLRIWNAKSGRLTQQMEGHSKWADALEWSPDGQRLASAGFDMRVNIWEVNTGKRLASMTGHTSVIYALAWHPAGNRLASFSGDKTVRLWDTTNGREIIALSPGSDFNVASLAWSGDGQKLIVVSRNGAVKVWDTAAGVLAAAKPDSMWKQHAISTTSADSISAEQRWTQAIRQSSDDPEPLLARGQYFALRHEWQKAAEDFVLGVELAKDSAQWRSRRKDACRELAMWPEAFRLATELRPDLAPLWTGQGQDLARKSRWREAAHAYARAFRLHSMNDETSMEFAGALLLTGDESGFRKFCRKLMEEEGVSSDTFFGFIKARAMSLAPNPEATPEKLLEWAKSHLENDQSPWACHVAGLADYRAGNYRQAMKRFEASLELGWGDGLYPAVDAQNWLGLAMCHHQLGQAKPAQTCLNTANELIQSATPPPGERVRVPIPDWVEIQVLQREAVALLENNEK